MAGRPQALCHTVPDEEVQATEDLKDEICRPPPRPYQPQPEMVCEMVPGQESGSAPQMWQ